MSGLGGEKLAVLKSLNEFNQRKLLSLLAGLREGCEAYPEKGLADAVKRLGLRKSGRLVARSAGWLRKYEEAKAKAKAAEPRKLLALIDDEEARRIAARSPSVRKAVADYLLSKFLGHPVCCIRNYLAGGKHVDVPFVPWRAHASDCAESKAFSEAMRKACSEAGIPGDET
ncbi:MAG: hypothetical protein QXH27_05610 [Candidatus Micrarchaeia archaeon]